MTPEEVLQRVQRMQERAKWATPEPWVVFVKVVSGGYDIKGPPCGPVGQFDKLADALFITSARANIPWLCEQVIQQQATIERLQAKLAAHRGQEVEDTCYFCAKADGGPAFEMGGKIAHVACVVRRINEILPLYEGTGEPEKIVIMIRRGESHDRTKE